MVTFTSHPYLRFNQMQILWEGQKETDNNRGSKYPYNSIETIPGNSEGIFIIDGNLLVVLQIHIFLFNTDAFTVR